MPQSTRPIHRAKLGPHEHTDRRRLAGEFAGAADSQNRAIEVALLLTVPAAAALLVIPGPIVSVLFERGAFSEAASIATSRALAAFAAGLPAYVLIKALTPGFFARQDTATPVKIAIIAVGSRHPSSRRPST